MGCTFRARLNHLCSIWYAIITTAIQAYLLYLGFERYRLYNEIKWPTGGYPHVWLSAYIILYASCIPCSLLFFAFGVFKSGNISGDNERLADREERVIEVSRNRNGEKTGCVHSLKTLWQHLPPLPQQIHVFMALCQLVAQQLMFAQLYRNGFINSGDFLNTEMDFLYQRTKMLATNLPIGESRLVGFRITTEELGGMPLSPSLLPLLMHLKLFGIPLEFLNLVVALFAYTIVYPATFWRVSKPFSIMFTLHLFIYSAQMIWSYLSFSVLYRIQETNSHSLRPVGLGQYLAPIKPFGLQIYHPLVILACYLVRVVTTTLAPTTVYACGYNKYYVNTLYAQTANTPRGNSNGGPSGEYNEYRRQKPEIYHDGYLPHITSIFLLVIATGASISTVYASLLLFQHEEKPLLMTCVVIDAVYFASWLFLWLLLTLKRKWNFHVTHKVHQLYALQKGIASGAIRGNENPSQLKNSVLVVHRDHMFVTDDQMAKQSLLRAVQTGKFEFAANDEVYWKHQASPSERKLTGKEAAKNSPDLSRLIRRPSEEPQAAYQASRGQMHQPGAMSNSQIIPRGNSSPPEGTQHFATMQRGQQYTGMGTLSRAQQGTLQRSLQNQMWQPSQEPYASIHKPKESSAFQRRGSNEGHYGQIESAYASYGTYARVPQVSRIQVTPQGGAIRMNGPQYAGMAQNTLQKRSIDGQQQLQQQQQQQQLNSIRQSPLLSERSSIGNPNSSINAINSINGQREQPYQRSVVKLSSFNTEKPGNGIYASSQWGAQRVPPGQPSQLHWGQTTQNKSPVTGGSSQPDEQCFTPTSTLTSQGSNYTPTPGSPQASTPLYARVNGSNNSGFYEEAYADRTLQKANPIKQTTVVTGNTSIRHTVKVNGRADDSANFSLGSSTPTSGDTARQSVANHNDFATSIV